MASESQIRLFAGGNFQTLMDFLNRRVIKKYAFKYSSQVVDRNFVSVFAPDFSTAKGITGIGRSSIVAAPVQNFGTNTSAVVEKDGSIINIVAIKKNGKVAKYNGNVVVGLTSVDEAVENGTTVRNNIIISFGFFDSNGLFNPVSISGDYDFYMPIGYQLRYADEVEDLNGETIELLQIERDIKEITTVFEALAESVTNKQDTAINLSQSTADTLSGALITLNGKIAELNNIFTIQNSANSGSFSDINSSISDLSILVDEHEGKINNIEGSLSSFITSAQLDALSADISSTISDSIATVNASINDVIATADTINGKADANAVDITEIRANFATTTNLANSLITAKSYTDAEVLSAKTELEQAVQDVVNTTTLIEARVSSSEDSIVENSEKIYNAQLMYSIDNKIYTISLPDTGYNYIKVFHSHYGTSSAISVSDIGLFENSLVALTPVIDQNMPHLITLVNTDSAFSYSLNVKDTLEFTNPVLQDLQTIVKNLVSRFETFIATQNIGADQEVLMDVINNLFNQFNTFDEIVAQVKSDIDGIVGDLQTTINDKIDAAVNSTATTDALVEAMSDDQDQQNVRIDALENNYTVVVNDLNTINQAITDTQGIISSIQTAITDYADRLSALETYRASSTSSIAQLRTDVDDLIANGGGGGGGTGDVSSTLIEKLLGSDRFTAENGLSESYIDLYVEEGYVEDGYIRGEYPIDLIAREATFLENIFGGNRFSNIFGFNESFTGPENSTSETYAEDGYAEDGTFVQEQKPFIDKIINEVSYEVANEVVDEKIADIDTSLPGSGCTATGTEAIAVGMNTTASGDYSFSEGSYTYANGYASHTEGYTTAANGDYSHAEGLGAIADGLYSHAEGSGTIAGGDYSHAEGDSTTASGNSSHAEGYSTTASGNFSHAEGSYTEASGRYSHAGGDNSTASHNYSYVQGRWLNTYVDHGIYFGNYNAPSADSIFVVGCGQGDNYRKNAIEVSPAGLVTLPSQDYTEASTSAIATIEYVQNHTADLSSIIDNAPEALDTLNELAAALGDDANFSATITNLIQANTDRIVDLKNSAHPLDKYTYLNIDSIEYNDDGNQQKIQYSNRAGALFYQKAYFNSDKVVVRDVYYNEDNTIVGYFKYTYDAFSRISTKVWGDPNSDISMAIDGSLVDLNVPATLSEGDSIELTSGTISYFSGTVTYPGGSSVIGSPESGASASNLELVLLDDEYTIGIGYIGDTEVSIELRS